MRLFRSLIFLLFVSSAAAQIAEKPNLPIQKTQSKSQENWFQRGRTFPGESAAALRLRAYEQKLQMRSAQFALRPNNAPPQIWQPLGPAPLASDASGFGQQDYGWVSGRATVVAIDRSDPGGNTVFVGGAYGGVWKSSNAASLDPSTVIWTPLIDNQPTLAVGAIAIQPQANNPTPSRSVVLVGTGETNSSTDSYYGLGILRSADGGQTWNLISQDGSGRNFAGLGFSKIAFSTANPNLAVAALSGASQGLIDGLANPPTPNLGIYASTNGGVAWNFASITDAGTTITPSSATSVVYNDGAGSFLAAIRSHGFYSSPDGINWIRLVNQPGPGLSSALCPPASSANCPIYRGEISAVPGRNEMYVWYVDANDNDQGIWQTTNGGNSWTQISTASIDACADADGCGTENGGYNLTLAAVADGSTATDLYAGAVNIYKCRINSQSPTCNGPNIFLDLTHVFGCSPNFGSLAHVHPAQHAMDALVVNGKSLLYFANDGGAYRALDGYTGLTSGDCASSNQFDSLNQTLGAMTQFVSFAQHPSDANTLLGGAQGNGSPATSEALVSSGWRNLNSGDGGYTAINPSNPTEWFTSTPGVNIQGCEFGVECHAQDFADDSVVSSATLAGDQGPFYTPFILDPQNPGTMIVGTCRVWRGATDGSNFATLSNNLDTGSAETCSGNEANLVRSIAAGGPADVGGNSQVIYAGTDGFGPLVTTVPAAGRVFVSKSSDGGTSTWADRTGSVNPQHFPISSIAMDSSDANGTTAYVAVMGFHVPHLWMTPSAGVSWFNFSGTPPNNLPDAPMNAVLVDPGPDPLSGTIYVGTDVGVFASSTASPSWTEIGPAVGQNGFLPNVPVTALRIFNTGTTKLLRASTYGRGLWQFPLSTSPDFQIAVANPTQTIFLSQTATFSGVLTLINGYTSPINLSCAAGSTPLPSTCTVNPSTLTANKQTFTVSASSGVGDYSFLLKAAGADTTHITHQSSLVLHVVDFGLSAPSPATIGTQQGGTTSATSFQVTALGSFQGTISLTCTGLPAGATCNFSPSDQVGPQANAPALMNLTISTAANTPGGSFPVVVDASTPGAPDKTQPLPLTVGRQDYSVQINNSPQTAVTNTAAVFTGTLTSTNFSDPVNLACGGSAPPTCTVSPTSVVPSVNGTPFTVTVMSNLPQSYNFNVLAQGTDTLSTTHTAPLTFTTTFDFSISANPQTITVTAGQSGSSNIDLAPQGGVFPFNLNVTCSGLPAKTSCSLTPSVVTAGSPESAVVLTITTTATTSAFRGHSFTLLALVFPVLIIGGSLRFCPKRRWPLSFATTLLLGALLACGGGLQGGSGSGGGGGGGTTQLGTTPGQYLISVTGTSGTAVESMNLTLKVQ